MALIWLWTALFAAACTAFGVWWVERVMRIEGLPGVELGVVGAGVGVVAFGLAMYAGGFLHIFGPWFGVLLPVAMMAVGAPHSVRRAREWARARREAGGESQSRRGLIAWAVLAFGAVGGALVYLGAVTPDAINFDAQWFHLALAADYARLGGIVPFRADYMRSVPHLASLLYTWAFEVPGVRDEQVRWGIAQHVEIAMFLGTLAGIAAMTRWLVGETKRPRGAWAAMFLFPAIFVYDSNLGAAADHVLAFFAAPLFLAVVRATSTDHLRSKARWALVGVLAGGAALTKYQAVYLLAAVFVVAAARAVIRPSGAPAASVSTTAQDAPAESAVTGSPHVPVLPHAGPSLSERSERFGRGGRAERGRGWATLARLSGPAVASLVFAVVVSPHFAMNWVFHRNPLYPLASDVFRGSTPMVPGGAFLIEHLWKVEDFRPQGSLFERITSSLRLVFTYSVEPHYSFTKDFPSSGFLFTLSLPVLPFLRRGQGGNPRRIWLAAAAGCTALFVWAFTLRIDRHLQTFTPLLVATTAAVLVRVWEMGSLARVAAAALVMGQIAVGAVAIHRFSVDRLTSGVRFLAGRPAEGGPALSSEYRHDYREVGRSLPAGAVVLMHNWRPNLGIDRDVLFDMPGQQGVFSYEGVADPPSLVAVWKKAGATHMLHRPGLRPAPTRQLEVLVAEVVARTPEPEKRKRFGVLELLSLDADWPAWQGPYRVLSLGLEGYENGLYPVESMTTQETLLAALRAYPPPEERFSMRPEIATALFDRANAVLVGPTAPPAEPVKTALARRFFLAVEYEGLAVWLRKTD